MTFFPFRQKFRISAWGVGGAGKDTEAHVTNRIGLKGPVYQLENPHQPMLEALRWPGDPWVALEMECNKSNAGQLAVYTVSFYCRG